MRRGAATKRSYRTSDVTKKTCSLSFTFSVEGKNKFLQSNIEKASFIRDNSIVLSRREEVVKLKLPAAALYATIKDKAATALTRHFHSCLIHKEGISNVLVSTIRIVDMITFGASPFPP